MRLTEEEWDLFCAAAKSTGELLYLQKGRRNRHRRRSRNLNRDPVGTCFRVYCDALPASESVTFTCRCRPFKGDSVDDATGDLKLFCLEAADAQF